jgi:hypothetical protein
VIKNNPNKNLIVSMSIKQGFKYPKRREEKETPPPQFVVITFYMSLFGEEELKHIPDLLIHLLSIGTPYY